MKAKPRVKICCIASVEEAQAAIAAGASALGLVSAMPSGPGVIEEDAIAESRPGFRRRLILPSRQRDLGGCGGRGGAVWVRLVQQRARGWAA